MANLISVLICTHNRALLLERVLDSINRARRPDEGAEILVIANACTDETHRVLESYVQNIGERLPLRWIAEPTAGKSHALNRAMSEIHTPLTAFVDDDHRVDENYLVAIEEASKTWPDAGLYCGRILPDWDGTEQAWVHDTGPYRIYPLPVPRYDLGAERRIITAEEGPIPGGGNLVMRRHVFGLAGQFSTELGPHGHDLGGGEDSEYVLRAMARGVRCRYTPDIVQFHYVDPERLKLTYLLKKSYQRTRSTARIHGAGSVPLYMWRKLAEYCFHSVFSLSWAKRRFYWVRSAAALGEISGHRESGYRGKGLDLPLNFADVAVTTLAFCTAMLAAVAWFAGDGYRLEGVLPAVVVAAVGTVALLAKSLTDFSQTGPRIREEILNHYRRYTLFALARLTLWAFGLMLFMSGGGVLIYYLLCTSFGSPWSTGDALLAAFVGLLGASGFQFVRKLRFNPGLLATSMHYRMSRLYPLWQLATPTTIRRTEALLGMVLVILTVDASWQLLQQHRETELVAILSVLFAYMGLVACAAWLPETGPRKVVRRASEDQPAQYHSHRIGHAARRSPRR